MKKGILPLVLLIVCAVGVVLFYTTKERFDTNNKINGHTCNPGYKFKDNITSENLKNWSCGSDCVGGTNLTDDQCNCACEPIEENSVNNTKTLLNTQTDHKLSIVDDNENFNFVWSNTPSGGDSRRSQNIRAAEFRSKNYSGISKADPITFELVPGTTNQYNLSIVDKNEKYNFVWSNSPSGDGSLRSSSIRAAEFRSNEYSGISKADPIIIEPPLPIVSSTNNNVNNVNNVNNISVKERLQRVFNKADEYGLIDYTTFVGDLFSKMNDLDTRLSELNKQNQLKDFDSSFLHYEIKKNTEEYHDELGLHAKAELAKLL